MEQHVTTSPAANDAKSTPAVELDTVSISTPNGDPILDRLTLVVEAGETVAIVGRSGAGKTTLLRLINRMLEPSSGTIRVAGCDVTHQDPVALRRKTGYVIQEVGLFPHWNVRRNVGLVPWLSGWRAKEIERRVDEMLTMCGLSPDRYGPRWPHELSGGERQRVGVARALAADPPLLLLDEPFGALDPVTRHDLRTEFRVLVKNLSKAAILVTHDLREALEIADRIGLLAEGAVPVIDVPERFLRSDHPGVRTLVRTLGDDDRIVES